MNNSPKFTGGCVPDQRTSLAQDSRRADTQTRADTWRRIMTADHPLPEVHLDELPQFRAVQQLAYRCVETVGAMLYPGITEKEAARLLTE
ncbi:Xaa-Pro aminopeptidase, partial [Paraburkholderia sp. SIMBA_050]